MFSTLFIKMLRGRSQLVKYYLNLIFESALKNISNLLCMFFLDEFENIIL